MITKKSNCEEIKKQFMKDFPKLSRVLGKKFKSLKRERRMLPPHRKVSSVFSTQVNGTQYVVTLHFQGRRICPLFYMKEEETNYYIQIPLSTNIVEYNAFTPHFFKRFALRSEHMELDLMNSIRKFKYPSSVRVYKDGNKEVHAIKGGLMLGELVNGDLLLFRTFVSADMLKETQLKAYEKVSCFISKYTYEIGDAKRLRLLSLGASLLMDEAQSIYEQFYE